MANESSINPLLASLQSGSSTSSTKKKDDKSIGQNEFLTMLVAQLKNQDPLNPLDNDKFAVDLAQFSQLESLVSIDQKLGNTQNDVSSYAAYLGREVTFGGDKVGVDSGDGGALSVQLSSAVSDVQVNLLDGLGRVVHQINVGDLPSGTQRISLDDLPVANGEYSFQVTGVLSSGQRTGLPTSAVGVVTGFVPGPTPALLVGNREISPSDIQRVTTVA